LDQLKTRAGMKNTFVAKKTITIHAPVSNVWDALTKPEMIKQYFFGTDTETDWKKGSPIFFRGQWEGKSYEDKGTILDIIPNKLIQYDYWSSFSGKPDIPENYATVTYQLSSEKEETTLTITQDGINTVEQRDHSESNWANVLNGLKKLVEKK
jgi:uncharacterized protein YndB with AHSA1/START domain